MTNIPVPQARYELLKDKSRKQIITKRRLCCISTIILIWIASVGVIFLFINLHYFINGFRLPTYYHSTEFPEQWVRRAIKYNTFDEHTSNGVKQSKIFTKDYYRYKDLQNYKLVCYYMAPNSDADLLGDNIDPFLCSHVIVGFARVKNNTVWISQSTNETLINVVELKKQNKNLKVMLSVGGAGNDAGFPDMVLNHNNRKSFIRSVVTLIKEFKLDGLDLDWEFPNEHKNGDKKQRTHFTQLLREIRDEINRHVEKHRFLLSVAVAAPTTIVDDGYDILYINQYVDFINLMSYDYHFFTHLTPFTGFNAPLYERRGENGYMSTLNINFSAYYWHKNGMDKSKIIIGLPTYGHSFELVNPENTHVGAPARGFGKIGSSGFVDYSDVCWFLNNYKIKPIFDLESKSPYAFKGSEWISFDDAQSLTYKTEFIKSNEFGGAMILSLNTDDHKGSCKILHNGEHKFPLTRKVKSILYDDQL